MSFVPSLRVGQGRPISNLRWRRGSSLRAVIESRFPTLPIEILPFVFVYQRPLGGNQLSYALQEIVGRGYGRRSASGATCVYHVIRSFTYGAGVGQGDDRGRCLSNEGVFGVASTPSRDVSRYARRDGRYAKYAYQGYGVHAIRFRRRARRVSARSSRGVSRRVFRFSGYALRSTSGRGRCRRIVSGVLQSGVGRRAYGSPVMFSLRGNKDVYHSTLGRVRNVL